MFPITLGVVPPQTYTPIPLDDLNKSDANYAGLFTTAVSTDVDTLNMSWAASGLIENYSEADLRANIPDTITALAQNAVKDKKIPASSQAPFGLTVRLSPRRWFRLVHRHETDFSRPDVEHRTRDAAICNRRQER